MWHETTKPHNKRPTYVCNVFLFAHRYDLPYLCYGDRTRIKKCAGKMHFFNSSSSFRRIHFPFAHFSIFSRFTKAHPCVTECHWRFLCVSVFLLRTGWYSNSRWHTHTHTQSPRTSSWFNWGETKAAWSTQNWKRIPNRTSRIKTKKKGTNGTGRR